MLSSTFVLGGKAVFTVSNPSGVRYTYRVKASKGPNPKFFAQLLAGPDNTSDYVYLGVVDTFSGSVRLTEKSRMTGDSLPVKVLRWSLGKCWQGGDLPEGYSIHHEGCCGRCGRALTVPESVESGFGPECIKLVGG